MAALCCLATAAAYSQTPFDTSIKPSVVPCEIPVNRGATALWQSLKKLHTRASVLMLTAHPDDEDGATLAYESRGVGARVALLTLNRVGGGPVLLSRSILDSRLRLWLFEDHGRSTYQIETGERAGRRGAVVRMALPLVITSVFIGGPSDGHGNHQVAGRMAKEVFEAAGDANRFPEQISAGLHPWKPLKYYARTPWTLSEASIRKNLDVSVGTSHPLMGESFLQLSREGSILEKSQNGGTRMPDAEPLASSYRRFNSIVPVQDQEQSRLCHG